MVRVSEMFINHVHKRGKFLFLAFDRDTVSSTLFQFYARLPLSPAIDNWHGIG